MRGRVDPQESMFSYFSPDSRVPEDHPLRRIKQHADTVLGSMNPEFDRIYAEIGRPSIAPERLLKASLLIALYSVRSDRLFCEMLDYNLLFRWFLDMSLDQSGLDQSNFSRLRERLVGQDTARVFFDAVVGEARKAGLLSDEHFTVDGTLIEAWASQKSFKPKDGPPSAGRAPMGWSTSAASGAATTRMPPPPTRRRSSRARARAKRPSSPTAAMRSWRTATACAWTSRCARRSRPRPRRPRRCSPASAESVFARAPSVAIRAITRRTSSRICVSTRSPRISPRSKGGAPRGWMRRTTRHAGYAVSQRKRKRVEEIFGWMKAYGGLRRTLVRGVARVQMHAYLVGAAYNLLRMSRLSPGTG